MKREVDIIEIDPVKREDHTTSSRTTIKMVIQKPNLREENTTGQIMYLTDKEAMLKVATEEEETVKVATEAETMLMVDSEAEDVVMENLEVLIVAVQMEKKAKEDK